MKSTELRQLIRESINEYIRSIDEAGENAALEAKMDATKSAIELREKKMNMDGLDEAYHDMLDKGKMKELSSEVKALKKSLAKYEKTLEKLKSKGEKVAKVEDAEEKEIVDEISLGEESTYEEESPEMPNESLNESFLYMQKLAGVITEAQYKSKKILIKEWKIDRNLANTIINADNIEDYGDYDSTSNTLEIESGSENMADYMDGIYIPGANDPEYWYENEKAAPSLSYQYKTAIKKAAEQRYGSNVKIEFF